MGEQFNLFGFGPLEEWALMRPDQPLHELHWHDGKVYTANNCSNPQCVDARRSRVLSGVQSPGVTTQRSERSERGRKERRGEPPLTNRGVRKEQGRNKAK